MGDCGKRVYPTRKAAIAATLRASHRSGLPLRVYSCGKCKGFHLTKQPRT